MRSAGRDRCYTQGLLLCLALSFVGKPGTPLGYLRRYTALNFLYPRSRLNDNPYKTPSSVGSRSTPAKPAVRRWTLFSTLALLNFGGWLIGIFFNFFGGVIDSVGASFCITTWFFAPIIVVASIAYSLIRRFHLPEQTWDVFGPAISVLAYAIMYLLMH